jgi:gamma-glutamyl:cysteine ligase YbdK (ATP-grasp superfamily)
VEEQRLAAAPRFELVSRLFSREELMGRRIKQAVAKRARAHQKLVKAGRKRRVRARSRGLHPASVRRRRSSAKRRRK